MTQVCHECGTNIYNPFYTLSAVLLDRENKRIAFSDLETTICRTDFKRVEGKVVNTPEEIGSNIGIAIDVAYGEYGGVTGAVQTQRSSGYNTRLQHRFINEDVAREMLRKSAELLFSENSWVELTDSKEWKEAQWAQEFYKKLKGE